MVEANVASLLVVGLTATAVVTSYGLAVYSWRGTEHPVSNRFALLIATDGTWALLTLLGFLSPTDALARLWEAGIGGVGALAGVLWFTFTVEYTGDSEWIPPVIGRVAIGQALVYGVVYAVNPGGLVYTDAGVVEWGLVRLPYERLGPIGVVELAFVYVLLAGSFVLLGRFFLRTRNVNRRQTGFIFGSALVVVLANVAFFAGLTPHPRLDLTPVFFVVNVVGVSVALYFYDFLDVTPLAAATLLAELSDPVFVVDERGRVLDHNDAAAAFVDGRGEQVTLSDVDIEGLSNVVVGDGGDDESDGERREYGGSEVWAVRERDSHVRAVTYDVRTTGIADQYGGVCGYAVVLRDVTQRIAQQRALESQNRRLEEFAGVVSHDLRNPLGVVDGYVELARTTGNLDYLDAAGESVERMKDLVDDLLRLASEGRTIDGTELVDLATCVRRAWEGVETAEATLDVETDHTVVADASRLRQVFENLFRNAVEHGGPEVTVTVGSLADGFYVEDDGPGIPGERRETVFEPGETTSSDGTGFGLAIVERIVEAHGWDVGVSTGAAGGARFDVVERYAPVLAE